MQIQVELVKKEVCLCLCVVFVQVRRSLQPCGYSGGSAKWPCASTDSAELLRAPVVTVLKPGCRHVPQACRLSDFVKTCLDRFAFAVYSSQVHYIGSQLLSCVLAGWSGSCGKRVFMRLGEVLRSVCACVCV